MEEMQNYSGLSGLGWCALINMNAMSLERIQKSLIILDKNFLAKIKSIWDVDKLVELSSQMNEMMLGILDGENSRKINYRRVGNGRRLECDMRSQGCIQCLE